LKDEYLLAWQALIVLYFARISILCFYFGKSQSYFIKTLEECVSVFGFQYFRWKP